MANYFKKGSQVIYHYRVWQAVLWSESGFGWVNHWKRTIVVENPRNEYGQFTSDYFYEDDVTVKLKDENGKVFEATIADVTPDVDITSLSHDELERLFGEIRRGSMYTSDYKNSFGVFEVDVQDYYDGFYEFLCDEYGVDKADKHDTADEFADYVLGTESYTRISA